MRRSVIAALAWAGAGFLALWTLRVGYGYLERPDGAMRTVDNSRASTFETEKRNYASTKLERATGKAMNGGDAQYRPPTSPASLEQKYERIADLRATSRGFDSDEAALRTAAETHGGIIQHEHKEGLRGARVLHLAVGVPPEHFDAFVAVARAVGREAHLTIDKHDRTNEWRALEAKRTTLESTRAALVALKQRTGTIQELTALEDRILEVHEQLQALGVSLGEFDQVNELCTVKLSLVEASTSVVATGPIIPLWQRARVAFEWAAPMYLRLLGGLLAAVLAALIGVVVVERLRPWTRTLAQAEAQPRQAAPRDPPA